MIEWFSTELDHLRFHFDCIWLCSVATLAAVCDKHSHAHHQQDEENHGKKGASGHSYYPFHSPVSTNPVHINYSIVYNSIVQWNLSIMVTVCISRSPTL